MLVTGEMNHSKGSNQAQGQPLMFDGSDVMVPHGVNILKENTTHPFVSGNTSFEGVSNFPLCCDSPPFITEIGFTALIHSYCRRRLLNSCQC